MMQKTTGSKRSDHDLVDEVIAIVKATADEKAAAVRIHAAFTGAERRRRLELFRRSGLRQMLQEGGRYNRKLWIAGVRQVAYPSR